MSTKICITCGNEFPSLIRVNGKKRNLCSRKRCLECNPFKHKGEITVVPSRPSYSSCSLCHKETSHRLCKACYTKVRRLKAKLKGIELLGGKCNRCGWSGPVAGFDFHHPDPNKEFNVGPNANRAWESVKKEMMKCELLCALCHRLEHADTEKTESILKTERLL